jgi:multiple sugar transport system substrate-binding protein
MGPNVCPDGTRDENRARRPRHVHGPNLHTNQAAKDLLGFAGTAEGQDAYAAVDSSNIATAKGTDTSKFTPLNKKCAEVIANAKFISQFFDRDALPAMANNVMIPALQGFIKTQTIDTANLESQAKSLYAQQ